MSTDLTWTTQTIPLPESVDTYLSLSLALIPISSQLEMVSFLDFDNT